MKKLMPILIIVLLFETCTQIGDRFSNEKVIKRDSFNAIDAMPKQMIDKSIIQSIKDYYQNKFGIGTRLEESSNDTIIELTYYKIPDNIDDYDGYLISIVIPKRKNLENFGSTKILEGDINNDLLDDLVICIHTEGGGGGGNVSLQDFFVFINDNGKLKFISVSTDGEISGCNGSFRSIKIEDNFLIGNSSCYTEEDARCCPSQEYEVKVEFSKNKLSFSSKSKIQ